MPDFNTSTPDRQAGFLLIEVLIAILVFSVGILAVIGLQAQMAKNSTDARYRAVASMVAERHLAKMWGDQANLSAYLTTTSVSQLPEGQMTVSQPVANRFQIEVQWHQPGQDEGGPPHRLVTLGTVVPGD